MRIQKWIQTIAVLSLACFVYINQAQEQAPSWRARAIAISDNGRHLALQSGAWGAEYTSADNAIWVYDLENILLPPQLIAEDVAASAKMIFSPNNRYLAAASLDELSIYDIENGDSILNLQRTSTDPPTDFLRTSFSPDGNYVMAFTDWWFHDGKMSIWNIHTGQRIHAIDAQRGRERVFYTWLSPDWSQLARWSGPKEDGNQAFVYEFDIENGLGHANTYLTDNGRTAAFSPDGSLFAVVTEDAVLWGNVNVLVYETDSWTLRTKKQTSAHSCGARNILQFSHNNSFLLLVYKCQSEEYTVLWNLATDELVIDARNYRFAPTLFSPDDRFMIGHGESGIAVWNIESNFEIAGYPGVLPAIHPDGELMVAIGRDGRLWLWNLNLKQLLMILPVPLH